MKKNVYDIAILGSGLSSLTAILKILETNPKLKICVISSNKNSSKECLSESSINYLKKNHTKIAKNISKKQVDNLLLKSSKRYKTSFIQTFNFGGFGSFWGGGLFPIHRKSKNFKEIYEFILKNFNVININKKNNKKKLTIRNNLFEIIEYDPKFIFNNFHKAGTKYIIDPGKEIRSLSEKFKFRVYGNTFLENFIFNKDNYIFTLSSSKNKKIYAKNIIIGLGVLNSPLFLKNSKFIDNENIEISEHKLYRIPFINLKALFNNYFFKQTDNNFFEKYRKFISLKESFLLKVIRRYLFIGIYFFPNQFFMRIPILNKLCNKKIIGFSQIYLGNEYRTSTLIISLSKNKFKQKIISKPRLNLFEIFNIIIFLFSKSLIPLPFKYSLKFGSSYHFYGSLKNKNIDFDKINITNNIEVIDSSTISSIGAEPSSFLLIKNSYLRTKKILKNFE